MRNRGLVLGLFVLAGLALAGDPTNYLSWTETQPSTRALPTGGCGSTGQGVDLTQVTDLHAVLRCSNGAAFISGWAMAYHCDPVAGAWVKAASYNDFAIPLNTGTLPDGGAVPAIGPDLQVVYPFGRFLYAVDGGACAGTWDGGITVSISRAQR